MATTVFNLTAIDRIEAAVIRLTAAVASLAQESDLLALTKIVNDLVIALGGGDQPAIDAATAALRDLALKLNAAVASKQESP